MPNNFTPDSLPDAIRSLFRQNNYTVDGPLNVHGAEIDLVARPKGGLFDEPVYIEATIEYVNTAKYGKDLTKLAMLAAKEPRSQRLIVSSAGFSKAVIERAAATGIRTLTYSELFSKFERFDPYIKAVLHEGPLAQDLRQLDEIYEEPSFHDRMGQDLATSFLTAWRDDKEHAKRWLIIVGEYGTGKTALTRVLQRRWCLDHMNNADLPLPLRIELRDFTRQFDARGLIHHFLDHNFVDHLPIDFVFHLIRSGRVLLLLDGYDEMAQYMHARERRACLEALAQLSADGAKGVLTSRPNYFSEAEELQVFEVLYSYVQSAPHQLLRAEIAAIEHEKKIDQLIEAYVLERFERTLKDLSPDQTEALVRRCLGKDRAGQRVVLSILKRVFRSGHEEAAVSLSGKPVIITYLLEIVEQLKASDETAKQLPLTEWEVYNLIIDKLMIRDFRRSQRMMPQRRVQFLMRLAILLSKRDDPVIGETRFRELVRNEFRNELRSVVSEDREREIEYYFQDLRSSSTLTRANEGERAGWAFSHNSLREFLAAKYLIDGLRTGRLRGETVTISSAMRIFVASRNIEELRRDFAALRRLWVERKPYAPIGGILSMLWDGVLRLFDHAADPVRTCLQDLSGERIAVNEVILARMRMSYLDRRSDLSGASFSGSELTEIDFAGAGLRGAAFERTIVEGSRLTECDLREARFIGSLLIDVDISGAMVKDADFRGIDEESSIVVGTERLVGEEARGYLRFVGARTDDVHPFLVYQFHPRFPIVDKVCRRLGTQAQCQRRGLEQRGAAQQDTQFARDFVALLERSGFAASTKGRPNLVHATPTGRNVLGRFLDNYEMPKEFVEFLQEY
jgi:uncharacterized protein YjbI with pentapeptide repeats